MLDEWEKAYQKQKIVGEQTYCDSIIQCRLLLKINYGLKPHQSTSFVESSFLLVEKVICLYRIAVRLAVVRIVFT